MISLWGANCTKYLSNERTLFQNLKFGFPWVYFLEYKNIIDSPPTVFFIIIITKKYKV